MPELLLELFSEEIPACMQTRAAEDLKRIVCDKLKEQGLEFSRADAHATPRRLALVIDGLPEKQPDQTIEKKGPRVGAPEKAIEGFLKSAGLTSLDQCEKRDDGKGEVWFASKTVAGRATGAVAAEILSGAIAGFPWPKSMRFASDRLLWVRPLHSILALFDGKAIAGEIDRGGSVVTLGNMTHGHRYLAPASMAVTSFDDYRTQLLGAKVILDPAERRASILDQAQRLAKEAGLTLVEDAALADEVTGLVEWPIVLMGTIDERFMALPPEVLTTTMRTNQKYFALNTKDGKLAPRFLVVSNMETKDEGAAIVAGNERVLRARLSDAEFFWNQDRKIRLEDRVPALEKIVFHAKLGTVADKMKRVEALAGKIARHVPGADAAKVQRAARLAKADLTTGMVGEFPELQGTMGRYYALGDGEDAAVADAISEHYAPLGPNDRCPTAPVSVAVALADKIDTLVGFFTIDEKPTGSKDPFELRRAALGVIRYIVENNLRVPIRTLFWASFAGYHFRNEDVQHTVWFGAQRLALRSDGKADRIEDVKLEDAVGTFLIGMELVPFFADRLKVALREKGVRHDLISAVFALGGEDDLVRLLARVEALQKFLESEDGANLLVAYRRAANIVRIEEKKDKAGFDAAVDPAKLTEAEEKGLHAALGAVEGKVAAAIGREDFVAAMVAMATLRQPVDAFFDKVTVNADDAGLRANRLRLLAQIRATLDRVADFSKIEG
ncbi:MAG: glycine--tRNA ligase subunit beta [Rhodospirillaceae bacterium]|nr:glycine--tRNA ligase subunit beta [Rhodospirillaceae bacterium]